MTALRLSRPEPREADVLRAVLDALAVHPKVAMHWRQNTGAGRLVRSGGQSQFVRFGFPGCPDVLGVLKGGRFLCVEVKRPSGRLEAAQRDFLERAKGLGACAFVARSGDDIWRELEAA